MKRVFLRAPLLSHSAIAIGDTSFSTNTASIQRAASETATHVLLGGVHEEHIELVEAVVDSLSPLLLHQGLVDL